MNNEQSADTNEQQGTGGGDAPLSAVRSLMDERRRYENWLSALDARRATTPDHVFQRVHGDYSARLVAVIERLTTHADALRTELDSLTGRLASLGTEQQRAQDERAEAELRAHVGELSEDAWKVTAAESDARLAELATRRHEMESEIASTRELLHEAERPHTPPTSTAAAPEEALAADSGGSIPSETHTNQPVTASVADVGGSAASAVVPDSAEGGAHVPSAAPGAAAPRASGATTAPAEDASGADALPAELPPSVIAAEQEILNEEANALGTDGLPPKPTPSSAPRQSRFDELAFLSSVVNTPSGSMENGPADRGDENARQSSFAARETGAIEKPIVNLSDRRDTPLDSLAVEVEKKEATSGPAVSGSMPVVMRDRPVDGAKTLKCSECGSMNYPTEWYCERCGAELASL